MRVEASDFSKDWRSLEHHLLANLRQVLGQLSAFAMANAKATTAFKDRTEALRKSIRRGIRGQWAMFVAAGGRDAKHATWIEDGSDAHEITPRRRKSLRFVQNGQVRFSKRVFHPGTKATHFMLSARDQTEARATQFVERGITAAIQ